MTETIYQRIESDSSIEITKNTKGYSWSVKAYGSNEAECNIKAKNLITSAQSIVKELESNSPPF